MWFMKTSNEMLVLEHCVCKSDTYYNIWRKIYYNINWRDVQSHRYLVLKEMNKTCNIPGIWWISWPITSRCSGASATKLVKTRKSLLEISKQCMFSTTPVFLQLTLCWDMLTTVFTIKLCLQTMFISDHLTAQQQLRLRSIRREQ